MSNDQNKIEMNLDQFSCKAKRKLVHDTGNEEEKVENVKHSPTKRSRDRFNGVPEEEVAKLLLPDRIAPNLDILIVGINPGLFSAYKGHHYANPGNHFWKCLHLSGFTPHVVPAYDDYKMLDYGIGFTNMVERTTRGSNDLSTKELREGSVRLLKKLKLYKPKIAVFNGKQIYGIFSKKKEFRMGKQPEFVEGTQTYIWVMPSSSARCSLLPRAEDKVPYFVALKKFLDSIKTGSTLVDDSEFIFDDLKSPRKR